MSTQTILGHRFPTPCKRCGAALHRQVDYCPYCGAVHPLEAGPHKRIVMPGSRASATSKAMPNTVFEPATPTGVAHAMRSGAATHVPLFVSPDAPIPPLERPPRTPGDSHRPSARMVLLAIAAVVVVGLAYVGYALFGGSPTSQNSNVDLTAANEPAAKSSAGAIVPYAPALSADQSAGQSANPAASAPVSAVTTMPPAVSAKPAPSPQYRDAPQAVQAARAALRASDLSAAQAALGAAQTLQPGNADAQTLQRELKPLAARRDAALQAAQACVAQQQWTCVRQHANDALTLDTGSSAAKSLLEHAIRETGWAPLGSHGATPATPARAPAPFQSQVPPAQVQMPPLPSGMPPDVATGSRAATSRASGGESGSVDARIRAIKDSGWRHTSAKRTNPGALSAANGAAQTATDTATTETLAAPTEAMTTTPAAAINATTAASTPSP